MFFKVATVLICSAGQIVIPVKKFLRTKGILALRGKQCHLFAKRWIILLFRRATKSTREHEGPLGNILIRFPRITTNSFLLFDIL